MLEQTFVHIQGIGYVTEQRLWRAGVTDWAAACGCTAGPEGFFAGRRWDDVRRQCEASQGHLSRREHRHFAGTLASRDQWRAFPDFRDRCAYVDIETTGMDAWSTVTVVGVYDGLRTYTFVTGDNMDELPERLGQYAMLVTFNGATFDLPFLRRRFKGLELEQLHVDLRWPLAKLGYKGGLKSIERAISLPRDPDIANLDGFDAVLLWEAYKAGDQASLDLLIKYNTADIVNLETLMELAYRKSREKALSEPAQA
jgi:uncharacterized protein